MPDVRPPASVKHRDEASVDRIGLARIHHALAFRLRLHPHQAHEEAILEVTEQLVHGVAIDRYTCDFSAAWNFSTLKRLAALPSKWRTSQRSPVTFVTR